MGQYKEQGMQQCAQLGDVQKGAKLLVCHTVVHLKRCLSMHKMRMESEALLWDLNRAG